MTENEPGASDRIGVGCDRASTAFAVLAGGGFLASFLLVGSGEHTTAVASAVALGGASLLCGGVSGVRMPEKKIGDPVPSPGVHTEETIRSRSEARGYAKLYAGVGLLLLVVGGFAALSTL